MSTTSNLPRDVQAFISEKYGNQPVTVLPLPYWSTVRFQASVAVALSYTIDTSTRTAFSYGINNDMASAGRSGTVATLADTNLQVGGQTRDNSDVFIWGISAYLSQESEPSLAARIWRECSLQISTNGTTTLPLGTLELFPAAGGLYGQQRSFLKSPDFATTGAADNGIGSILPFANNGNPMAGNFFRIPQPLLWTGLGSGGSDTNLAISCTPTRTITEVAPANRVAAAGIGAVTAPTVSGAQGTFVDVRFHLTCVAVSPRSKNA